MRLMRAMRWSYHELMQCPVDYIPVIAEEFKREADEARRLRRAHE